MTYHDDRTPQAQRSVARAQMGDAGGRIAEQVTHSELIEALRRKGCTSLNKVRFAVLEHDGTITGGMRLSRPGRQA